MNAPGRDRWRKIAQQDDLDDVRERILTGAGHGRPFTEHTLTIELPASLSSVLDFGCGLGRNFDLLKSRSESVTGYDLDAMIDRCRALPVAAGVELSSDWPALASRRFDLVFSTLVLQHVDPDECRQVIHDFSLMAPWFYLATRTRNDFGPSIPELILDSECFEDAEWIVNDIPPDSNRFQVNDRVWSGDVAGLADETHLETLLTSRIFAPA